MQLEKATASLSSADDADGLDAEVLLCAVVELSCAT
jgi:hypothetical protein